LQKAPASAVGAREWRPSELRQNQLDHDSVVASQVCSECRVPIEKNKCTMTLRMTGPPVCSKCIVNSIGAKSQKSTNRKQHVERLSAERKTKDQLANPVKKIYQCKLCTVQFSTNSHLKRHAVTHTKEYQFTCDVCNKRFSQLPSLKRHTAIHNGEKPYVCEVCSKSFTQLGNLKRHSVTHTGERPFMCEVCNKRFSLSSHLKEHFVMHTGEKPYICEICSKRFSHLTTLRRHSITHTGEKPFACSVCNKRFSLLFNLKKHTVQFCNIPPDRLT